MFTADFWRDAAERAISTAAQTALALLPASATGLVAFDWRGALVLVGSATAASLLKALAANRLGDVGTASFVSTGRHAR